MKKKKLLATAGYFACLALASCDNGTTGSDDSLFGEIPGIYEEKQIEFVEKMKNTAENEGDGVALAIIAEMEDAFNKAKQEARSLAEKMKGNEPILNRKFHNNTCRDKSNQFAPQILL